jgi:hypothetical protein
MLKITYLETGLYIERSTQSLEEWIALRSVLSLRAGYRLQFEPCSASLLLAASATQLSTLETVLQTEAIGMMSLSICDADYVEVSFQGIWLSSKTEETEGVFVMEVGDRAESLLLQLWQESQVCASSR